MQVCEEARINYDTLTKKLKQSCTCRTDQCPAWGCWCDPDDETGELEGACKCPPCDCDVCSSCKVIISFFLINVYFNQYQT